MISLVTTVRDEAETIAALLDSMLAQTRRPDEIIVNDCLSKDDTPAIVQRYIEAGHPIRLVRGGTNIPSGRNNAIRHARGTIIASTDAGLTLDPGWLAALVAPIEAGQADVVGGFFRPDARTLFEIALAATNYPDREEVIPERFLPFGQSVAFRREAWEHVGGYPEWANHCEDLIYDLALKKAGYRFAFAPDGLVHFRPRESLAAFWKQYRNYARGDGVADLWRKRHAIRYATYLGGGAIGIAARAHPWLLGILALGGAAYCATPLRRLLRRAPQLPLGQKIAAMLLIPLIRVVGDLAKMIGYPEGIIRRMRNPRLQAQIRVYGKQPDS
ncbi:MAG: glycosyltransferase [Roseiflexaceae bacterium]